MNVPDLILKTYIGLHERYNANVTKFIGKSYVLLLILISYLVHIARNELLF